MKGDRWCNGEKGKGEIERVYQREEGDSDEGKGKENEELR